ncbi:MAG: ISNCY family transposase [bacterium]|nr:ISNCY family transposase [bacterium]
MRTVTLSPKQQRQVDILTRLEAGTLDMPVAAQFLGRSPRQVRRLRVRFRQEGMAAVLHSNQGRSPVNRTDPAVVERICTLAGPTGPYHDFNVCHLQDQLARDEQIVIGRSTLDRLLKQHGLRRAAHPPPVHRRRRPRCPAEGMLLQMDGSSHDWLEGRGPRLALHGAIDDATGKIVGALFRPTEDQLGYLLLIRAIAETYGLPMAVYHDRHTILRSPKQPSLEEELAGQEPMSQIQRLLAELGIESIPAHSPQAKGRVERLWGTLQDRLTKELRLARITTLEEANAFLPGFIARFNERFAKEPQDCHSAWVPLPAELDRAYYFAIREMRTVRADHCISWAGQLYQLEPSPRDPSLVREQVSVHVVPEGGLLVYHGKQQLSVSPVCEKTTRQPAQPAIPLKQVRQPAVNRVTARQRSWLYGYR